MAYDDMTDAEVLKRAADALAKVTRHPMGSVQRAIQWGVYNSCAAELERRAYVHALARIRQRRDEEE